MNDFKKLHDTGASPITYHVLMLSINELLEYRKEIALIVGAGSELYFGPNSYELLHKEGGWGLELEDIWIDDEGMLHAFEVVRPKDWASIEHLYFIEPDGRNAHYMEELGMSPITDDLIK